MPDVVTIVFERVPPTESSGYGDGSAGDPVRVLEGASGDEQLDALLDAIEAMQGTRPSSVNVLVLRASGNAAVGRWS